MHTAKYAEVEPN